MERIKRIALVQCPCFSMNTPPLGIAYLCSALLKEGYQTKVFDFNPRIYSRYPDLWDEKKEQLWFANDFFLKGHELDKWISIFTEKILEFNPEVIGFSVQSTSVVFSMEVSKRIKELSADKFIIFGGPECLRENPEFFLKEGKVDYVVQGDGEVTLMELLKTINQGSGLNNCNGIAFNSNDGVVNNPPRSSLDVDSLPIPDFSLFELEKYLFKDSLPMITSKGCIRRCLFCSDIWYHHKYMVRKAESIVSEIEHLIKLYNIKRIEFFDLLLNGDLNNLEKMCDLLIQRNNNISWCGNAVIRKMSPVLLKKLYQAGCRTLIFGVESFSQRVIDSMHKGFRLKEARLIIKQVSQAGISVYLNIIIGFPGEERKDLEKTAAFILKMRKYIARLVSIRLFVISSRSVLSRESSKLNIQENTSPYDWECQGNNLNERLHRYAAFAGFADRLGLLQSTGTIDTSGFSIKEKIALHLKGRAALSKFVSELNSDQINKEEN